MTFINDPNLLNGALNQMSGIELHLCHHVETSLTFKTEQLFETDFMAPFKGPYGPSL